MKKYFLASIVSLLVLIVIPVSINFSFSQERDFNLSYFPFFTPTLDESNQDSLLAQSVKHLGSGDDYDLDKALLLIQKAHNLESNHITLKALVNIHFTRGEYKLAANYGDEYITRYRGTDEYEYIIHYLLGLNYAYANGVITDNNDLDVAENHFQVFFDYTLEENKKGYLNEKWAHYLDLAWVKFRKGDFNSSATLLEEGLEKFPNNPWILSSLAISKFNLDKIANKPEANNLLIRAEKEAEKLTIADWRESYSTSNSAHDEINLEKFKQIIKFNQKIVSGSDVSFSEVAHIFNNQFFANHSPDSGILGGGLAFSACHSCSTSIVSCTTTSATNSCGQTATNSGIRTSSCTGRNSDVYSWTSCSASTSNTPANPSFLNQSCTIKDICGRESSSSSSIFSCQPTPQVLPEFYYILNDPNSYTVGSTTTYPSCNAAILALPSTSLDSIVVAANSSEYVRIKNTPNRCFLIENNTSQNAFVPLKTEDELNSFIIHSDTSLLEITDETDSAAIPLP